MPSNSTEKSKRVTLPEFACETCGKPVKHSHTFCPECEQERREAAYERDREDYLLELDELNEQLPPDHWK